MESTKIPMCSVGSDYSALQEGNAMPKRTPGRLDDLEQLQDLDTLVVDKRRTKRANNEKARRRNRRYQKRLLGNLMLEEDSDT